MESQIRIKGVTKGFGDRTVLDDIDLDIHKGEIFGIIGMSGSGKTTFLHTLIGFLEPELGDIEFFSSDNNKYFSVLRDQSVVRRFFGFSTQAPSFYPKLTVFENLQHFGSLYSLPRDVIDKNAHHLLELIELSYAKDFLAGQLSGGMKKKLSLACSMMHKPGILVLDEPTADLDPLSRIEAWDIIKGIHSIGTTVVIASHFLDELESVCDRIAILHDKKIVAVGAPEQLKERFFNFDEVRLHSSPGHYSQIANSLKRHPGLKVIDTHLHKKELVVHTANSEALLHQLIHLLGRLDEKIINVEVSKPSLTEIFESFKKG